MNKNEISLQVYTARFSKPYEDIFNFLSTQGMKKVELFEVSALEETKEILDKYSMTSASTHFGFDNLKDIKNIIEKLKKANIQYAIVPAPPEKSKSDFKSNFDRTEEEWNDFGKELSSYVEIFEDNGLKLGYHNHSFEFNPLPSGKMPIECILDQNENLKFEIDLGWVVAGKADPILWTKKYASKIIACHLKDFTSVDMNLLDHNSQCAIGDGFIDWKDILLEVKKTGCNIFALEHDDPKDYKEYVTRSLNYLSNLEL